MSIDEYSNTQWVVCEHYGSELRVWYTPNPNAPLQQKAGRPACRKGILLEIRATIESVEIDASSDKSRPGPEANGGLLSTLCDVFTKKIASNKRRKDV